MILDLVLISIGTLSLTMLIALIIDVLVNRKLVAAFLKYRLWRPHTDKMIVDDGTTEMTDDMNIYVGKHEVVLKLDDKMALILRKPFLETEHRIILGDKRKITGYTHVYGPLSFASHGPLTYFIDRKIQKVHREYFDATNKLLDL